MNDYDEWLIDTIYNKDLHELINHIVDAYRTAHNIDYPKSIVNSIKNELDNTIRVMEYEEMYNELLSLKKRGGL